VFSPPAEALDHTWRDIIPSICFRLLMARSTRVAALPRKVAFESHYPCQVSNKAVGWLPARYGHAMQVHPPFFVGIACRREQPNPRAATLSCRSCCVKCSLIRLHGCRSGYRRSATPKSLSTAAKGVRSDPIAPNPCSGKMRRSRRGSVGRNSTTLRGFAPYSRG